MSKPTPLQHNHEVVKGLILFKVMIYVNLGHEQATISAFEVLTDPFPYGSTQSLIINTWNIPMGSGFDYYKINAKTRKWQTDKRTWSSISNSRSHQFLSECGVGVGNKKPYNKHRLFISLQDAIKYAELTLKIASTGTLASMAAYGVKKEEDINPEDDLVKRFDHAIKVMGYYT